MFKQLSKYNYNTMFQIFKYSKNKYYIVLSSSSFFQYRIYLSNPNKPLWGISYAKEAVAKRTIRKKPSRSRKWTIFINTSQGSRFEKVVSFKEYCWWKKSCNIRTLRSPGLKVKLLVGPTCQIPRSTQRSVQGIRRSPKMCQGK